MHVTGLLLNHSERLRRRQLALVFALKRRQESPPAHVRVVQGNEKYVPVSRSSKQQL
jgi:hypothetical protein